MTQSRIVWTTRQVTLLVNAYLDILQQDLPDYRLVSADDRVGSQFIQSNIVRAQHLALDPDYWRKHFTKKQILELNEDVSRALWQKQLENDKRQAALAAFPLDTLLEEIARRNQDALLEKLLDRIEPALTKRMRDRVDELAREHFKLIEARLRHDPTPVQGTRQNLPRYVVIGLLRAQANELSSRFEGRANIVCVDKDDVHSLSSKDNLCSGRICLVSRFVSHSIQKQVERRAAKMIFVSGGVTDFEHVINGLLHEFNSLKQES